MDPLAHRNIGNTPWQVTRLGFGGATLGDRGTPTPEGWSDDTVGAAWAAGIGYFDTAPYYGLGKSEHRLGRVLRNRPRESFTLSTKVGRVMQRPSPARGYAPVRWTGGLPFEFRLDYTRDGVLRSFEDSLQRLGLNCVEGLLIHDLDLRALGTEEAVEARFQELDAGGGFAALAELKASGDIFAIGAGVNHAGMVSRYLERFPLDFFIIAMAYTLLSQEALEQDLALCRDRGVSVVIGAPFASGILARGPGAGAEYGYRPAEEAVLEHTRRIAAVCERHQVPLAAAALQFPLGHPAVAAVIPGPNTPEQVRRNVELARAPIPPDLWLELKAEGLIHPDAPLTHL